VTKLRFACLPQAMPGMFRVSKRSAIHLKRFVFTLAGIGLLAGAFWSYAMTRNFIIHAKTGNGEVVALNAGGSHPQIQFTTEAGQKVSFPQGGLIFGYHPGEQVRVLYTPSDPAKSHTVDAFGALWFSYPCC
jgi:hypothetical protein